MKPKTKSVLSPGFKKKAEELSKQIRLQLGLRLIDACPARKVAALYGVSVTAFQSLSPLLATVIQEDLPALSSLDQHLPHVIGPECGFSAIAIVLGDIKMVLYNSDCSPARQESDIMHELAHIICEHPGDALQQKGEFALRQFNNQCEEEAICLGACLQVPELGLLQLAKKGLSTEQIAEVYGASVDMTRFRRNKLAIDKRLQYLKW